MICSTMAFGRRYVERPVKAVPNGPPRLRALPPWTVRPPEGYHLPFRITSTSRGESHHEVFMSDSSSLPRRFETRWGDRYRIRYRVIAVELKNGRYFDQIVASEGCIIEVFRIQGDSFCAGGNRVRDRQSTGISEKASDIRVKRGAAARSPFGALTE